MAKEKEEKIQVMSIIGATINHDDIVITPKEVVSLDCKVAKILIEKKFVKKVSVKEV